MTYPRHSGPGQLICIGRKTERESLASLLDNAEDFDTNVRIAALRGIGGIGKTTLGQQFCLDALGRDSKPSVINIDCSSLSPTADIASILRLLARAGDDDNSRAELLLQATYDLDILATKVRNSEPPSDSSEDEKASWRAIRSLGLEALVLLSSAALEAKIFGQVTSTAENTVLAGVRAIAETARSARGALVAIAQHLYQEDRITSHQLDIAKDPEGHIVATVREYFRSNFSNSLTVILWDKAENLTHQIFRLNDYFMQAIRDCDVVLVYAGRLTIIPVPDGSQLSMAQYLQQQPVRSVDLELAGFTEKETSELLSVSYERRHGVQPPGVPSWLTTNLQNITDGLPLWIGILVDALTVSPFDQWETNAYAAKLDELSKSHDNATDLMRSVFRDMPTGDSEQSNVMPIIAALALAPSYAPKPVVIKAAGLADETIFRLLTGNYSFMRNDRLHDNVRSVVRQYLATSEDGRAIAREVATHLLEWVRTQAPSDTLISDGGDEWTTAVTLSTELAFWIDGDRGAWEAASSCLASVFAAPWVSDLLFQSSWFLDRISVSKSAREMIGLVSRLAFPMLLARALTAGQLPEKSKSSISDSVKDAASSASGFRASLGRTLDRLQYLVDSSDLLSAAGQRGLRAFQFRWLVFNGFDDEALELSKSVVDDSSETRESALLAKYVGESIGQLVENLIRLAPVGSEEGRVEVERAARLGIKLIELHPPTGADYVARNQQLLSELGELDRSVEALMQVRRSFSENVQLFGALGHVLIALGRFEEASRVFGEGIQSDQRWLRGWCGRIDALVAMGRTRAAAEAAVRAANGALGIDQGQLTKYGMQQLMQLISLRVITSLLIGDTVGAEEFIESLDQADRSRIDDYTQFMLALFTDRVEEARRYLELVAANSRRPNNYACELALVAFRMGREAEAAEFLSMAATVDKSKIDRAFESILVGIAKKSGWLPQQMAMRLTGEEQHVLEDGGEHHDNHQ